MKKTKLFGLLMAMIVGVSFTACTEDDENPDSILITIDSTTPIPTEAVPVGTVLDFKYVVVSDNNIEEIIIREGSTVLESIPNDDKELTAKKSHNGNFSFETTAVETLKFAIEVEDSRGNFEILDFEVEVVSAAGEIEVYEAKLLGSFTSTEAGSFYSTTNNQVYMNQPAFENQALIDFVYFYGSANQATIAAPDDAGAAAVYTNTVYGLSKWTTKRNATKFKISLKEQAEFEAVEDDALIVTETNLNNSSATKLVEGNVVAFETEAGKKGLFLVKSISGTAGNSTITIEVKVQK